jgi:PAS domain S-box-containing protein
MAVAAVAASVLLRYLLVQGLGMEMPAFITFYPAIVLVALLAGFWPGIFATALSVLSWNYLFLAPIGHSVVDRASDFVALSLFSAMGVFISLVAERYRRNLRGIADLQAEQLRQASEYQRLALEAADLGAWDLHIETGDVLWDDRCRTGYGLPSGDSVTYEEAIARILPEDRPGVDEAVKQAIAGIHDGAYHRDYRVAWPDGSIHWIASHGRVYFDGEGDRKRAVRFLGVNADITGRKQAEQAQAADRAKLDVALASMTDALFIADASGKFIQFNDAFATFHKFRNKSECADTLSAFQQLLEISTVDGEPLPHQMWSTARALRGETATNVEYRLRRKDTGETWIGSYSFNPLRDEQGVIVGAVVVARDITAIKAAEQKLRESERDLSLMYRYMHDIVFYLAVEPGDQYSFRFVNPAFLLVTGLKKEQVEGKLVQEVIPEPSLSMVLDRYREAVRERKTVFWEDTSIYPTGEKRGEVCVTPIFDEKGVCTNLIGIVHDITEKHRTEQNIRKLNRISTVLSDVNQTIVREKDSAAMLEATCRIAVEKGQFRMTWIGMVNPDTKVLEPVASSGVVEGYLDRIRIDFGESAPDAGPAARCFFSGKHAICNDIEHELRRPWLQDALLRGYRSEASFPLLDNGTVIGIVSFYAGERDFFDEDEVKLLDEMAMDISFALRVNRNEEQRRAAEHHVQQLNRVYAVLSDVNQTIVREKDSTAMLEAACRIAVEKGQFRMAWIGMINPNTHVLEPVASSGEARDYLDLLGMDFLAPGAPAGPLSQCLRTGKYAFCNDIEHDPLYSHWRENAMRHGFRSSAGFPLFVDGAVVGAFNFYSSKTDSFADDELALLGEMAKDISFALEVNSHEADRRKKEEELGWRTAFFEAQIDSSIDGVLVVDSQGKVLLQNQRMRDLFHIPAEIAGDPYDARLLQYVHDLVRNADQFQEKIQYLYAHPDQISRDEIELIDGTILDRYSAPVRDKAGSYYGRIWTFRDITQSRQIEEQFRQAQKMESIGQLTGGIAHDFNNLLTVIQGCSEFLAEETRDNPRLAKMAGMILDASRRGSDLTHRMLAFARRQALQPRPVDINLLLSNMESFLRRTLSADIDLQVVPSSAECHALIDPTQLESALLNLCVNARDAMPGGGKLIVETRIVDLDATYAEQFADVTPGRYIQLAVSDTGTGISPENLVRVFDPFFTTKGAGKGTGLGLSMVYGFIKQSQGHIRIYSELEQGTSVKLYLPIADKGSEPARTEPAILTDFSGSETILLVEDNDSVREYAISLLADLGYRVLPAANGRDALEIVRSHGRADIDLLFTDVVMPGMNGRELAIEACKLNPRLKVLYCSGYAEQVILHQGLQNDDVCLLNKPYSRLEVARSVRTVLSEKQSTAEGG